MSKLPENLFEYTNLKDIQHCEVNLIEHFLQTWAYKIQHSLHLIIIISRISKPSLRLLCTICTGHDETKSSYYEHDRTTPSYPWQTRTCCQTSARGVFSHIHPTLAADTSIFRMTTVWCEGIISAASQSAFITIACYIIKKNRTSASPKASRAVSNSTCLVNRKYKTFTS